MCGPYKSKTMAEPLATRLVQLQLSNGLVYLLPLRVLGSGVGRSGLT